MRSVDEARAMLARLVKPLQAVETPLGSAMGLRLAADVVADVDLPPADVSAVDGYAVRAADLAGGAPLPLAFVAAAGSAPQVLPDGAAARIFTGAVVPGGADTVVAQEHAQLLADGTVHLVREGSGSGIRRRGESFTAGASLARQWDLLTPRRVGLVAAGGAVVVRAVPRPRVAVISTGNELVGVGERPGPGRIRDSNGPLMAALARQAGAAAVLETRVDDSLERITACLEDAFRCADIVVTSGGVSAGAFDLVPDAVVELGGEVVVHGIRMRPGKALVVARVAASWLLGLPGNPGAVLAGWRMFVRPLIEARAGDRGAFAEAPVRASLAETVENRGAWTRMRFAVLDVAEGRIVATVAPRGAGVQAPEWAEPAALVRLDVGQEAVAGSLVECFPLPWKWNG